MSAAKTALRDPAIPSLPGDFLAWQDVPVLVGSAVTRSLIARPATIDECRDILEFCRRNGLSVCPRGSGRSYGDAILNDHNVILDMTRMNRVLDLDTKKGTVTVEPGARLVDVYEQMHHRGWTIPASPTDSTISVGGALGANVNGKDSWRVGNFGDQVVSLKVLTAAGELLTIDRERHRDLFMAVVGGMGLLALVVEVQLRLAAIATPYLDTNVIPAENLDALLALLRDIRDRTDFIVVWIDAYARDDALGRAVIHATSWSDIPEDEAQTRSDVDRSVRLLATQKKRALGFYRVFRPFINFGFQFQRLPISLFNKFYYALNNRPQKSNNANGRRDMFLEHNFDKSYTVPPPDILCGPHGYTVQITIPEDRAREAMTEMLALCRSAPCPPATTILRLHRSDQHVISFSENGYSLNVEFHPKKRHQRKMAVFMEKFIDCGIRYGSRVHLPKDHTLTRDQFRRLFPRYQEFLDLKNQWDPDGVFQSDMFRRLFATNG